jgi:hypothetical protein
VTVPSEPESARGYTAEIMIFVLVHRPACSRIFFHAWFSFIRVGEGGEDTPLLAKIEVRTYCVGLGHALWKEFRLFTLRC